MEREAEFDIALSYLRRSLNNLQRKHPSVSSLHIFCALTAIGAYTFAKMAVQEEFSAERVAEIASQWAGFVDTAMKLERYGSEEP